jgi:type II restriction/modification system DNA methylase subunit YeeA
MNKAKLKSYAPAARRDFIQAVTDRAHFFGISDKEIVPVEESGDVAIIGGRPFPRAVAAQRRKLDARVKRDGFSQVMEAVAYTWFNRFLALRYMELHGYLEHGFRVLSNTGSSTTPEILDQAAHLDLPGLNKQKVTELKLDGNKDAELYRILLVAQFNALHSAMPFLFEKIEDETELLLPDNLLHSDSLIRKLVTEIDEEDWQEVEIIGWLYQCYISEKKDQVIGNVVKSEDIPAATQLFTPNWIVKYMVQNCLGRQWMETYPDSPLKKKMEYYIEPGEQSDDVNTQLASITPDSLDPEKLTLFDPASGSGHILVEAYDVFREIYLERGYSKRDFPRLILEKNLYGLDIDDRAAQMACFALLMKARKDDRSILRSENPVKLNVMAFQESANIVVDNLIWEELNGAIRNLVELFRHGKTYGSLIQISENISSKLPLLEDEMLKAAVSGDLYASEKALFLLPIIKQSMILSMKFDCVIANPPYLGSKGMNSDLKQFLKSHFPDNNNDMFAVFIEQSLSFAKSDGKLGFVAPFLWMFIASFENLRLQLLDTASITSLIQLEYNAFEPACVPVSTFTVRKTHIKSLKGGYIRLSEFRGSDNQPIKTIEAINNRDCGWFYNASSELYNKIPGKPIAYWISTSVKEIFAKSYPMKQFYIPKQGLATADNERFLRLWYEVSCSKTNFNATDRDNAAQSKAKWFPHSKGGRFRRWYGNNDFVINWENDGYEIRNFDKSVIRNPDSYFRQGITWSDLTSSFYNARKVSSGFVFDTAGPTMFPVASSIDGTLCYVNSKVFQSFLNISLQGMHYSNGVIATLPFIEFKDSQRIKQIEDELITISKRDWDSLEYSWDFQTLPVLNPQIKASELSTSWHNWQIYSFEQFTRMRELEMESNRLIIEDCELQEELTPDIPEDQISLTRAERQSDVKRLISYAIGCIMGRYCLDQPGLMYANSGNLGFDSSNYQLFPADDDGIVPVMDMDWFPDDAASRFDEFLKVSWSPEMLENNLKFVAESFSPKGGETPRETIRRYISTQFYKDHLQIYKKRPIYWLFSSGKQRAFECLVYVHRYNESTLSRMRNEYVTPLHGKFFSQADYLSNEINAAASTAERNRLQKQIDTLRKKQAELATFDDLLRHYADQRISLDLDDGVKVNYGKFGNLLAEVKTVTGGGE